MIIHHKQNNQYQLQIQLIKEVIKTEFISDNDVEIFYQNQISKSLNKQYKQQPHFISEALQIFFISIQDSFLHNCKYNDFFQWFIKNMKDALQNLINNSNSILQKDNNLITLPYSYQQQDTDFIFTRYEIFGILACSFFGIERSKIYHSHSISFNNIMTSKLGLQKMLCIISYFFVMILYPEKNEKVHFIRKGLHKIINWEKDNHQLIDTSYGENGIETSNYPNQIDFANKNIHLFNISGNATQEEIIFAVKPECYLSILLFDTMASNECIIIDNCLTISNTTGFKNSFRWKSIKNETQITFQNAVIAIDSCTSSCFTKQNIIRDLNKCYIGFSSIKRNVATGQWGCGVFANDPSLKYFQQVLVASSLQINIKFHWIDQNKYNELHKILTIMRTKNLLVKDIYLLIINYTQQTDFLSYLKSYISLI
ncbi:poly(ADP-ribose) glycohydrolase, putative [Entamoeba dispar SAW760]|uniref:Poly(ADP-ribose) glycohydrolase, putative n=1 Tax=Entamoeba dispar (strain ATCC PRA-260 / SAW760) TaxID=370354 RepID=B0EHW5_ENTDS|nr:poly(ADP-ribose) glycohydrolase, putative [Entamoeba dispar SAW760]EDR25909.1 poly(ADP-ribose) glycohydrolase, putative [Entamoeba dispar SAW760]|eukprot:EDR25909.1 poly(ADP-ribose) glycohydrolase, putative [Entamoeba dispar SAW760]